MLTLDEFNRQMSRDMLGLEAYETFPDGSKRYLSPDEIRRDISFAGGKFFVTPSNTIDMVTKRVRTHLQALTRYYG